MKRTSLNLLSSKKRGQIKGTKLLRRNSAWKIERKKRKPRTQATSLDSWSKSLSRTSKTEIQVVDPTWKRPCMNSCMMFASPFLSSTQLARLQLEERGNSLVDSPHSPAKTQRELLNRNSVTPPFSKLSKATILKSCLKLGCTQMKSEWSPDTQNRHSR